MNKSKYTVPSVQIRMVREGRSLYSNEQLDNSVAVANALYRITDDLDREQMMVITMDPQLRPINFSVVAVGSQSKCDVNIANLFKTAILSNAYAIIVAHNHPNSVPKPSQADLDITAKIYEAGNLLGIPLLDHIILGYQTYYSLADHNQIGNQPVASATD